MSKPFFALLILLSGTIISTCKSKSSVKGYNLDNKDSALYFKIEYLNVAAIKELPEDELFIFQLQNKKEGKGNKKERSSYNLIVYTDENGTYNSNLSIIDSSHKEEYLRIPDSDKSGQDIFLGNYRKYFSDIVIPPGANFLVLTPVYGEVGFEKYVRYQITFEPAHILSDSLKFLPAYHLDPSPPAYY